MNLRVYWCVLAAICLMGCGRSSKKVAPVESIAATSGTPQMVTVNTAFAPLVATVTTGGTPTSGVVVTFTAPAETGASGTFSNGTNTIMVTTGANGQASEAFTANGTAGPAYTVTATVAGVAAPAGFILTNTTAAAELTCPSGSGQSATVNTAFAAPLVAQVADSGGNPVNDPGVVLTFTAPAETGASGTFANGTNTTMVTTGANGAASATFTANGTAGPAYTVTAEAAIGGEEKGCNFMLTNTSAAVTTQNFTFYLSGQEYINHVEDYSDNFYALAGAVTINTTTGAVTGGVQDYNNGFGVTSPQPSGDTITGGQLTVSSTTGQGTLTLVTNNTKVGNSGAETLGVQFVNGMHALIIQFDGSATSSGSMDLQTLPSPLSAPTGAFSFAISGVDPSYNPIEVGGVFSSNGTSISGYFDYNDYGTVVTKTSIPAGATITAPTPDSFGRGTITGTGIAVTLNYYIVGPEAIRIIDVDTADSAVGSAFGQGTGTTFSNASLGNSVFSLESNSYGSLNATAGMFSTSNTSSSPANFSGVGDDNEYFNGIVASGAAISGTYSINIDSINGYGSLTITPGDLGDVSVLGIYMVDPHLNINDPNNTTGGGGALVADLDAALPGTTGVLVPQTDPSGASFTGNYAFGGQAYYDEGTLGWEFDFIGQGSVFPLGANNELVGNGDVSDPFDLLTSPSPEDLGVTFGGTAAPDPLNLGRYTMYAPNLFVIELTATSTSYSVAIYQASGGQLFWVDEDNFEAFEDSDVFGGSLQQQSATPTPLPAVKAAATTKQKQ
jgi:hypothetical protein